MKANKWANIISLNTVYACAIINAILFLLIYEPNSSYPDSITYIKAWHEFSNGNIDSFRTPTYPFIYGLCETIIGERFAILSVIVLQHIVFLLSIRCFYHLALATTASKKIAFGISLVYALCPTITSWNLLFLTESFTISFSVICIYAFIRSVERESIGYSILFSVFLFLLIFLRPAQIYYIPATILICFALIKKYPCRVLLPNFAGAIIVLGCILGYMYAFEQRYGIFASSSVSVGNQYYLARQYGYLDSSVIKNPDLRTYVEQSYKNDGKYLDYAQTSDFYSGLKQFNYPLAEKNEDLKLSIKSNKKDWLKGIYKRFRDGSVYPVLTSYTRTFYGLVNFGSPNFRFVFILIIGTVVLLIKSFRKRTFPWITSLLLMLIASNLFVTFIGAQDEWPRLNVPIMPFAFIIFAIVINTLGNHIYGRSSPRLF